MTGGAVLAATMTGWLAALMMVVRKK